MPNSKLMTDIIQPRPLQSGDTIGITCPAGYVSHERIAFAVEVLQRWGFAVRVGKTVGTGAHYFSGHDSERLADLQAQLDDPTVRAILMGRGGYGLSRIIDDIDWKAFKESPKWICGFSDVTVLHSHIHQMLGIATLHSPMCGAFTPESERSYYIESLRRALAGKSLSYTFPASPHNRPGEVEGIIVGGNLAILAHLSGSVSAIDTKGKMLFIEDIGEHLYHIDRLLLNLKRSGRLESLKALLVGTFTDTEDTERPFGQTLEQIILDKVSEYNYPVAFNIPCGHETENLTLPLGVPMRLSVGAGYSKLGSFFV